MLLVGVPGGKQEQHLLNVRIMALLKIPLLKSLEKTFYLLPLKLLHATYLSVYVIRFSSEIDSVAVVVGGVHQHIQKLYSMSIT
jgi:hypothetical protein